MSKGDDALSSVDWDYDALTGVARTLFKRVEKKSTPRRSRIEEARLAPNRECDSQTDADKDSPFRVAGIRVHCGPQISGIEPSPGTCSAC